ncbi:uncharacterized protein LOC123006345 isoform X2 [Tribolium madens]|uniref:uncharacterized protein LOC123006345 isoform X2 n=1 Tax=Tribolium madens TaxID=41895 RepID=UPI001CF7315E|nr:uncharacterized protein LOC123006345 isoform X2 [Tribolium madens]
MAVPFVLPEDEINNLIVSVILILSQTRLQRNEENRELQECMEELVRLLAEELQRRLRSSEYDNQLKQTLLLLRQSLSHFTPPTLSSRIQRRSNFESCCDDCKISLHEDCATKDCSQEGVEEEDEEKEEFVEESLLSRLVPRVRTFWKAVPLICVVGLHLFQISYSM